MLFYLSIGGAIYYYDFFEANLSNFLINFLKEGDVFFDVEVHVGYYTMRVSIHIGENGEVHSFEPTPRTFESLKQNSFAKSNITVSNNAILNEEKEITFFDYVPKFSAFNSFEKGTSYDIYFKDEEEGIKVRTISLDNYCNRKNIKPHIRKENYS